MKNIGRYCFIYVILRFCFYGLLFACGMVTAWLAWLLIRFNAGFESYFLTLLRGLNVVLLTVITIFAIILLFFLFVICEMMERTLRISILEPLGTHLSFSHGDSHSTRIEKWALKHSSIILSKHAKKHR